MVAFVEAMLRRFPEPALGDDDFDEDDWVWSDASLLGKIEGVVSVPGIFFSRADEVTPVLLSGAKWCSLNVINWQTGELYKVDTVILN